MIRLLNGHRLIRPTQSLNIRSRLVHPRRNLMQNTIFLLVLIVLIRSRIRVVTRNRVRRVNRSPVLMLLLIPEWEGVRAR